MAESIREIKLRIKTVKNIQQIAKAMEMVAAARFRKMQTKLFHLRNYLEKIEEILSLVISEKDFEFFKFFRKNEKTKKIILVVFSGERGLCGAYNSNLIKAVQNFLDNNKNLQIKILISGKKIFPHFKKFNLDVEPFPISGTSSYKDVRLKSKFLKEKFLRDEIDEIFVLYTKFLTTATQSITVEKLLPVEFKEVKDEKIIFEPEREKILEELLTHLFEIKLFSFAAEAKTSEEAQRMLSMRAASDNAKESLENLTLSYNKLRQTIITKEIIEITSAAEAIK
jgi:F-type H+-transporting ATPase subunit gamma